MTTKRGLGVCGWITAAIVLAAQSGQFGCQQRVQPVPEVSANTDAGAVVIDGSLEDWRGSRSFAADDRFVYVRWSVPEVRSLGAGSPPILVELDLDGSAQTGSVRSPGDVGVDLSVEFAGSGMGEERPRGPRIQSTINGAAGSHKWQDVGLYTGPTHASKTFEMRLDRRLLAGVGLPGGGAGTLSGRVSLPTRDGSDTARIGEVETIAVPALGSGVRTVRVGVPPKPAGSLRLVSYNVLWGSPHKAPDSFSRIFRALDPDLVLAQEWQLQARGQDARGSQIGETELESWFAQHVARGDERWTAECTDGLGVAVMSRMPLLDRGPQRLDAPKTTRWDFPVRFAAGVVRSPIGDIVVGTVHLKASGALGSEEDTRRLAEAAAVNQSIRSLGAGVQRPLYIIGGDFNMNGSTAVIDDLRRGLDADGSDLEAAVPRVLGENLTYTFVGQPDEGRSTAVRLDYFIYPGSALRVAQSFVLDTSLLSDDALKAAGLQRTDSWGSDHLPVVIDLLPVSQRN